MSAGAAPPGPLRDEAFLRKLEYLRIVSRRVFAGRARAERRSRRAGAGLEFADHRDYVPGDDVRYLDWNVYGRLDRLLLRLFEEEEDLHVYLLVDASRSMGWTPPAPGPGGPGGPGGPRPTKLAFAAQVAAALCYVGLANLDRVGVAAFSDGLGPYLAPARGRGRIFAVLDFLAALRPAGATRLRESLAAFAHRTARRGVAVVLSDLYDPDGYAAGIDVLRHHGFEPHVVQVHDPAEARPPLLGDLRLVDCETGAARDVTVSRAVLERYAREHARYLDEVAEFCRARQVPCFRAHTGVPFDDLVLRVLRHGLVGRERTR